MRSLHYNVFYIYQAFRKYRRGFRYLINRYLYAPKILKQKRITPGGTFMPNLSIHMLVCSCDHLGGLWALMSFLTESKVWGSIFIHNDGSLTRKQEDYFIELFPSVTIVSAKSFSVDFQQELKAYPTINNYRKVADNFQAKKLIDTFFVSREDFALIMDPDILWFSEPKELQEVLGDGVTNSLMMGNGKDSPCFVDFNDGTRLSPDKAVYNSGIVLYRRSKDILVNLEQYLDKFDYNDEKIRSQHFFEQAGFASILPDLRLLPEDRYIIKGKPYENIVARHYTGPTRAKFYLDGIMNIKYHV